MIRISEEFILSGIHMCAYQLQGNAMLLIGMSWILGTAWETLALSLAVWIAIKHFLELQRTSTGWAAGDCFTILVQTHVFYFARWGRNLNMVIFSRSHLWRTSFLVVSCLHLIILSPKISVCYLWPTRLHPTISHDFYRTQIRLALPSFLMLFQLLKPCRCLCWDHASSLAFETIRLNSWPTPTRELPWLQSLSRRAYKFQLVVVCSAGDARIVHTRWVPYGEYMNFVWLRSSSYLFIASNTVFQSMYIIIISFIPSYRRCSELPHIFEITSLAMNVIQLYGKFLAWNQYHVEKTTSSALRKNLMASREYNIPDAASRKWNNGLGGMPWASIDWSFDSRDWDEIHSFNSLFHYTDYCSIFILSFIVTRSYQSEYSPNICIKH